jgi:GNAT superfamily N-acetyltransferase
VTISGQRLTYKSQNESILAFVLVYSFYMEIYTLQTLPQRLLELFTDESSGASIFSELRTSQTGNERRVDPLRIKWLTESPEHIMLVACESDTLMGMIVGQRVVGIGNEYFYVHDIVVSEASRGTGIGSRLMDTLITQAKTMWPEIVRVQCTSRTSRGTRPFFEKNGFKARTKENDDETIVYVKDFAGYIS